MAKPEAEERRVAGTTRPSVSAAGTALELLFSSALSSGRGSSNPTETPRTSPVG